MLPVEEVRSTLVFLQFPENVQLIAVQVLNR